MKLFLALFFLFVSAVACLEAADSTPYPPTKFPDASGFGKNIQRTMRLLATSTAEKQNTVRILFYGQSITESGRIVIETNDWNVPYAMSLAGIKPIPEKFTITWNVQKHFADEFVSPGVQDSATETTVTLAQGLPYNMYSLEISGGDATPMAAVRIYQPPLGRK